jgi:cytidylate kinase
MIVAIDGPAASGKSTTAKAVAKRLGFTYVDSGAMYRAVTLMALREGVPVEDAEKVAELAKKAQIEFKTIKEEQHVFLNGEDVSEAIRLPEIAKNISPVAANPKVREILVRKQREMGQSTDIVMDGRDIGTVVFPDADVKIYLIASVEERAKRRMKELKEKGITTTLDEIKEEIARRDHADMNRNVGPLKKADDAIEIDTSHLTIEEQVEKIVEIVKKIQKGEP